MENNWEKEVERRLTVLEEMLKVKKPRKCTVCGFDMGRPWTCEKAECPRVGRMA